MKSLRTLLLLIVPMTLAAACAASVANNGSGGGGEGGEGGESSVTTTGGGGKKDAGLDANIDPDVSIPCDDGADCAALNTLCAGGACVNGICERLPVNEYGACDDGLYCTENDTCVGGLCVGGTAKFCPSQDNCHLGACDEDLKTCKNIAGNEGAQCEDGDPCTGAGICKAGACSKGSPVSCAIYNTSCSFGVCDPVTGCMAQPTNENGYCNNNDFTGCSVGKCQQGFCTSVPQNEGQGCDDGKFTPCSEGQCQGGACVSQPLNDGQPCDDGLFCTINDACTAGSCSGSPNPCAPPENPCMIGVCDEFSWSCTTMFGNNGMPCEDGNFCSGGEVCSNGQCVGGQPSNEGVACDDANGCTEGTSCANGTCANPVSEIMQCGSGDACCPSGCNLNNDTDCLYWVPGVQQNVDPAILAGWSQCWSGKYDQGQPSLQTILAQCDKSKLLMACRPVGAPTYTLLAMAPRPDVLFDCGTQVNCTKQSNNVGWYFATSHSWGFAPGGQPVNRTSCDYNGGGQMNPELRMCWHTSGNNINGGYRCGSNDLNGAFNWERVIYEAD